MMLERIIAWLNERIPRPIAWLKSIWIKGGPSTSRITVVMAAITLCYSTIILSKAIPPNSAALAVVVTGLTGLCGYAYGRGRTNEERTNGDVKDVKPTDL